MQAIDEALLRVMFGWGEAVPFVRVFARAITSGGGSRFLIPLGVVVGVWLFAGGHRRRALLFWTVTLVGRVVVELSKVLIDRPRPMIFEHQVDVFSLSFPSGHAANSTIVYLAIALIALPMATTRSWPIRTAVALALIIGLTRPILGVHYPSDVVAGWAIGAAWTLGLVRLCRPWLTEQATR